MNKNISNVQNDIRSKARITMTPVFGILVTF